MRENQKKTVNEKKIGHRLQFESRRGKEKKIEDLPRKEESESNNKLLDFKWRN